MKNIADHIGQFDIPDFGFRVGQVVLLLLLAWGSFYVARNVFLRALANLILLTMCFLRLLCCDAWR